MNSTTYGLKEEIYTLGDECRTSYGIVAYSDAEVNGTATIIASVSDVTSDKQALLALVEKCNRLQLAPYQLPDVVDDFLV